MRSFTLSIGGNVNSGKIDVQWKDVLATVKKLHNSETEIDYIILSPTDPLTSDKCTYIRVIFDQSTGKYIIEAAIDFTRYIFKTANVFEVENILEDFYSKGRAPNIEVWGWNKDVDY